MISTVFLSDVFLSLTLFFTLNNLSVEWNDCLQNYFFKFFYIFLWFDIHECEYNSDLLFSFHSLITWHPLPMLSAQKKTNRIQIVCLSRKEMNNYYIMNDCCLQSNAHAFNLLMHYILSKWWEDWNIVRLWEIIRMRFIWILS